LDGLA